MHRDLYRYLKFDLSLFTYKLCIVLIVLCDFGCAKTRTEHQTLKLHSVPDTTIGSIS
jgi:hypothetical protein